MIKQKIQTNKVYKHLSNSNKKIIVEQGGTRSGKTYNIILWIIFKYCTNNTNKVITICRKSFPSLRATVMRDFMSILHNHNIYSEIYHNKSNSEYHLFGNLVEFISLDQPQKIRGRKRDLLFVNEGNELYYEDMQQLLFRTQERVILDFNPSDEYHWIYDKLIPRNDCDFFKTTYLDNPFIEDSIRKEIEKKTIKLLLKVKKFTEDNAKEISKNKEIKSVTQKNNGKLEEVTIELKEEHIPWVTDFLVSKGIQIFSIEPQKNSLEDIFLKETGGN